MTAKRSRYISDDESELIRFQLASKKPREVKAGLQRLCTHYEQHYRFRDANSFRVAVRGLLWSDAAVVRRWAFKAIAFVGHRDDIRAVIDGLKSESDIENQTWAMAAIIALAGDADLNDVCSEADIDQSEAMLLAARLFAKEDWIREKSRQLLINIDRADALTLKWAALLAGYGRAPAHLFHPAHENSILLGELNGHPTAEVSEYSVWAFWQNPAYSATNLQIPIHDVKKRPHNVRRWINRLLAKDPHFLGNDLHLFDELRRDEANEAREGLALGIREIYFPNLDAHVLDWHDEEADENISDLLLEHMAFSSSRSKEYPDLVERSYRRAPSNSGTRKRLLAASEGQHLYGTLRRIDLLEQAFDIELQLPHIAPVTNITKVKVQNMTNFNAGRDIVGQNLVGGDMIASANAAIQSMPSARAAERDTLAELVHLLNAVHKLGIEDRTDALRKIEDVAKNGGKTSKQSLLEKLKAIAAGTAVADDISTRLTNIIDTIKDWAS